MSEIDAIGQYFAAAREAELKEQMFERRARAIAREEIEAAKEPMPKVYVVKTTPINQEGGEANSSLRRNVGEDKSPPAVEAPAAGEDTTALARRLAEVSEWGSAVLENIIASDDVVGQAVIRLIEDALAEARKHKLIE